MSTSVSSVVSHFPKPQNGFVTTLASTISSGATTVPLNSVSGYTNGDIAVFVVDPTDATKKQTFTGVVDTSGVQITSVVWTAGTNQSHSGGATVVDYATATHIAMMSKGILVEHAQDGTHGDIHPTSINTTGTVSTTGTLSATTANLVTMAVGEWDGWQSFPAGNYLYVSATSFKITGADYTSRFFAGVKIKLTQTTAKYFYVISSSFSTDTTVTVTGGSDYSVANAAITSPYYSYSATPRGFPQWFNYTPTFANTTLGNGSVSGEFMMTGKLVQFKASFTLGTTSAVSANPTISLPVTAATIGTHKVIGSCDAADTGTADYGGVNLLSTTTAALPTVHVASGTYGVLTAYNTTVPHTWGSTDIMSAEGRYEAA